MKSLSFQDLFLQHIVFLILFFMLYFPPFPLMFVFLTRQNIPFTLSSVPFPSSYLQRPFLIVYFSPSFFSFHGFSLLFVFVCFLSTCSSPTQTSFLLYHLLPFLHRIFKGLSSSSILALNSSYVMVSLYLFFVFVLFLFVLFLTRQNLPFTLSSVLSSLLHLLFLFFFLFTFFFPLYFPPFPHMLSPSPAQTTL